MRREQETRLRYFLTRQLYPFSSYYRRLFDKHRIAPSKIKSVGDLRHIPFTTKNDFLVSMESGAEQGGLAFLLRPDAALIKKFLPKGALARIALLRSVRGEAYVSARLEREYRPIFLTVTAGTTHSPVPFLYAGYDIENLKIYGRRFVDIFGIKSSERCVNVFPYAPHLAFWQTAMAGFASSTFIFSTGGGKTMGTEGNIASLLKIKPHTLIGMPSYIYHILKTAAGEKRALPSLGKIILGAGRVPQGFKEKLIKIVAGMGGRDTEVLSTYGFTEARCAWAECPTHDPSKSSGYHTYPDKEIFEVVDPITGEPKRPGEDGEIVYTNLDSRGTCVLRYRTGDLVRGGIVYEPCPYCGRTVPRLGHDIERASQVKTLQVSKIKGTQVNLNALEHYLSGRREIDEWQLEIAKKDNDPYEIDELNLYVTLLEECDHESFAGRLNEAVLSMAEVAFNKIIFVTPDEMKKRLELDAAVKVKRIVDRRPAI